MGCGHRGEPTLHCCPRRVTQLQKDGWGGEDSHPHPMERERGDPR